MIGEDSRIAESVGRRVLAWRGAEFLEFLYLIEETHALETLRAVARLSKEDREKVVRFFGKVNARADLEIEPSEFGIAIRQKSALRTVAPRRAERRAVSSRS